MKLDGELLEPQIQFDIQDRTTFPEAKASYLCNPNAAVFIREFLETYFKLFDSDSRSPLMAAYHPEAMMSITVAPANQAGRINKFWNYNRNLRRTGINEEVVKYRLLKVGNLPIVATLTELPKTQHDLQSFTVDLTLFVEGKMMIFTVGGLFKEMDSTAPNSSGEIRYFRREFVVVPNGPGSFCIRNELFFVTSAMHSQVRTYTKHTSNIGAAASTSTNPMSTTSAGIQNRLQVNQSNSSTVQIPQSMLQPTATTSVGQPQLDDNTKMQMVQALSLHSQMNLDWSKKCLEETNWDYDHAAFVFDKLQKESKIPPQAFVK